MEVDDRNKVLRMVKTNITFESEEKLDALEVIEETLNQKLSKLSGNDIFFAIKEEVVKKQEMPKKQDAIEPAIISPSIARMTKLAGVTQ